MFKKRKEKVENLFLSVNDYTVEWVCVCIYTSAGRSPYEKISSISKRL